MWRTTWEVGVYSEVIGDFNPRPPCGGRRLMGEQEIMPSRFQSTSPVWRTTTTHWRICQWVLHFNPRPPCGGRPLCELYSKSWCHFNPRPPCGGRLKVRVVVYRHSDISIHVPRVEDDKNEDVNGNSTNLFQSTSPVWRTTLSVRKENAYRMEFQSTSPVWRTTGIFPFVDSRSYISIHVPRVEDDFEEVSALDDVSNFNPRPPCGGRHGKPAHYHYADDFNPRPPCGGRPASEWTNSSNVKFQSTSPVWRTTSLYQVFARLSIHFNPRPPCGGRPLWSLQLRHLTRYFNPRPPCGGRL